MATMGMHMPRHVEIDEEDLDEDARVSCVRELVQFDDDAEEAFFQNPAVRRYIGSRLEPRTWRDTVADALEAFGAAIAVVTFGVAEWVRR